MSVTTEDYQSAVHQALRREFGPRRNAAKLIARLSGASPRTAENWLAGLCAPQGAALLNLMARCEAVEAEVARLTKLARGECE
jgi:hypothetical protein